jgi:GNAT superfamily N-acetyltransferase
MPSYVDSLENVRPEHLAGFFVGWPDPPSPQTHLQLLRGSSAFVLALDGEQVVGFVTAVSDGVLCAYLPLLEVLPSHQGQGIGQELVRRILARLRALYMVDLMCDPPLQPFYEKLGMRRASGMILRDYARQSGA